MLQDQSWKQLLQDQQWNEFIALEMVGSEAEWLKNFLANIPVGMKPTPFVLIHCDFQWTITLARNKNYNGKNIHIQFPLLMWSHNGI